jgi:hypothetical protein
MDNTILELLNDSNHDNDKLVSCLSDCKRGSLDIGVISRVLLDLNSSDELAYDLSAWKLALNLLPGDSLQSLKIVVRHLDHLSFYEMDEEDKDLYFDDVNKAVEYLVRPYAYLNPEELVLNVAADVAKRDIDIDSSVSEEVLFEVSTLSELIVGGGHYVNVIPPTSLRQIIENIESMVL